MKKQKKMIIGGVTVGIVACLTLGAGIYIQKHHNKSTFGAENQTVSDEVAEIESINAKDNVVDVENLFEGEKVPWKEKQEIKKDASKNLSSNKSSKLDEKVSESDKKLAESDKLSEADKKPSEPNKKPSNQMNGRQNQTKNHQNQMNGRQNQMKNHQNQMNSHLSLLYHR